MVKFADVYGMADENTIRASQELDKLINEYHDSKYAVAEVNIKFCQMPMIIQLPFWDLNKDEIRLEASCGNG